MSDDKLKKLKRWAKVEAKKVPSFLGIYSASKRRVEEVVWAKVLKRIEYYLHQK
jgi:hypothetical protein